MSTSAFSLSHEWNLHWTRIPSNIKVSDYINGESPKERKALEALAAVGIIEGAQLFRLFSLDKKRLIRMVLEKKIVRHELKRNKQIIPIFTLGINGAVIVGLKDCYDSNYWVEYKIEGVLKRLLFFQLFQHFPGSQILPTQDPFSGAIEFKGKPIYVYVVRGDVSDLLNYLKWRVQHFNERLIIVAESLQHLQSIIVNIVKIKVRVIIDMDMRGEVDDVQSQLYYLNSKGEFEKEAEGVK
ncbi:hypothetical protein [Sporosarcina sp. E16_8]|uniref:hypothetical protein n=1 Tax=Sporosarcina sp. E16_8 TaxID=2789295 RepID=UPI001A9196F8|nr:hypothetical protein [Sporosarcina sp. E16_8]MBO0589408.1 hypothetical protein [Sporosarcina sp. E16_8]